MSCAFSSKTRAARVGRIGLPYALAFVVLAGAGSVHAQPTGASSQKSGMPMDRAAQMLDRDPNMKNMSQHQRMGVLEFVGGNLVYVLMHEMGHAQISERALPVLGGRDEDAADVYAITAMLGMGNMMSDRVLEQSAMGWFLMAKRGEKSGAMLTFYDEHGLDKQRAFYIVCLMVGSDPKKFRHLADESKLPESRRESCGPDYRNASFSWRELLKPHRRGPDQPKTKIEVVYGEAKGKLKIFADSARSMRLLETLADWAADEYVWKAPFTIEMKTCGETGANWSPFTRKVMLCYEMAEELAEVYRKYGKRMKAAARKPAR